MLVGRDRECAQLRATLRSALEGRTRIVALRGEPGIGKTRLLEFAVSFGEGFRIVRMQGHETEREIPFAALSALTPLLQDIRPDLPEVHVAALEAALDLGPAVHGDQAGVAAAALAVLAAAADRQPLLIAADDVHLIDRSSVEVLGFALRRLRTEPVAVVLTARVGTEVPDLIERLLEQVEQIPSSGSTWSPRAHSPRTAGRCRRRSGRRRGAIRSRCWRAPRRTTRRSSASRCSCRCGCCAATAASSSG